MEKLTIWMDVKWCKVSIYYIIADSFTDGWLSTQVYQFPTPTTNAASVGLKVSEASCWKLPGGAPGAYLCWFISRWTVGFMVDICGYIYNTSTVYWV